MHDYFAKTEDLVGSASSELSRAFDLITSEFPSDDRADVEAYTKGMFQRASLGTEAWISPEHVAAQYRKNRN